MTSDARWDEIGGRVDQRYYGKYHGFVVDNQDPRKRGRLRVLVPEVLGEVPTGWAEPCVPYGGGHNFGSFDVPPVTRNSQGGYTTGVWVEFRGGNPQYPIWVGCFYGAPGGEPEAPGDSDDDRPDIDVHAYRTFSGHAMLAVDTPGAERLELRDTSGQRITMSSPLRDGAKRDRDGNQVKSADAVSYGDLVSNAAKIEITDFAGNNIVLDATRGAPAVKITNTGRDGVVHQTVELDGSSENPQIVIRDNHDNEITLDRTGIQILSPQNVDRIVMNRAGIQVNAPNVNINSGIMGAARLNDTVSSTITEDPVFWSWVNALMSWLSSHTHHVGAGLTTPPTLPFPGTIPGACIGKIIKSSKTVVIGD